MSKRVAVTDPENRGQTGSRRGPDGKFLPGGSGNPGGRPKAAHRVIDLARENTELAITTLAAICSDEGAPASARVAAANHLLDRGWGRPRQSVEVSELDREPRSIRVTFVNPDGREVAL